MTETEEQLIAHNEFVEASVNYLAAMQARHGTEKAHELWTKMGAVIGPEVQMDVFKLMLTGDVGETITFRVDPTVKANGQFNKVNCIKAVRSFTELGLKEAKDIVDQSETSAQAVKRARHARTTVTTGGVQQTYNYTRDMCIRDLRGNGILVRDRGGVFR